MSTIEATPARGDWLERLAPLGAIVVALWILIGFFTSADYEDTAADVLRHADEDETNLIAMQVLALALPILIGWFLYGLLTRFPFDAALRTVTAVGMTLFIAFLGTGLTLWNGPLLDDSLGDVGAETYLALDDAGWILLGIGGVSIALAILAVSAAALRGRWVPTWVGAVSAVLGLLSLATVAGVGFFAWIAWLLGAGVYLLLAPGRAPATTV